MASRKAKKRRKYFEAYRHDRPLLGMINLSPQFFSMADYMSRLSRERKNHDQFGYRSFSYASIVFYVSSVEAYLNECITRAVFAVSMKKNMSDITDEVAHAKERSLSKVKIDALVSLHTGRSDLDTSFSENILLLTEVRNEIIHYTPTFNYTMNFWPSRLELALKRSGFDFDLPTSWTDAVTDAQFLDWAREVTKAFLIQYHSLVGGAHPFDPEWPDPLRWNVDLPS